MAKKTWTTPAQVQWLEQQLPAFLKAQEAKTTPKFFAQIYISFFQQWPIPLPTASSTTLETPEQIKTKDQKAKENRIRDWFYNHTRGSSSGTGSRGTLKLTSTRLLQSWQAFQKLFGDELAPKVDTEWQQYRTTNPTSTQTLFQFCNMKMQAWYEESSPETKAQVEEYCQKNKAASLDNGDDQISQQNQDFQNAINKLPRTIERAAESIFKQTGWACTIIVGGPMPRLGGTNQTLMIHRGATPDGRTFDKFLGEDYESEFIPLFDSFLEATFDKHIRNSRALSSHSNSPQPPTGLSDYELQKETNILRNKQLLADLGLKGGMAELLEKGRQEQEMREIEEEVRNEEVRDGEEIEEEQEMEEEPIAKGKNKAINPITVREGLSPTPPLPTLTTDILSVTPSIDNTHLPLSTNTTDIHPSITLPIANTPPIVNTPLDSSSELPSTSILVDTEALTNKAVVVALPFLKDVSSDEEWQTLISRWILFELENPPASRLPTTSRPPEIGVWLKNGRHFQAEKMPIPVDVQRFGTQWNSWWHGMQPKWRRNTGLRTIPTNADWSPLVCGGANGLLLVILALAWWKEAGSRSSADSRLGPAIDDVSWILTQLRISFEKQGSDNRKRQLGEGSSKQPMAKRAKKTT